uniref:Nuclear receptor domain-containing protein n=1 Tax=Rhabditophanes sp. KR3021 TaxID=114890 RepID=A0AC35TZ69_9BILA
MLDANAMTLMAQPLLRKQLQSVMMASSSKSGESKWENHKCDICEDVASGKRLFVVLNSCNFSFLDYGGVLSCNGCKGFFRRTIRKKNTYHCRFNGNCKVDKDHRNTCRKCRFEKCISCGMMKSHVQNERDRISLIVRSPKEEKCETEDDENGCIRILEILSNAEAKSKQLRASVITRTSTNGFRTATTVDVTTSISQQLHLMIVWAKNLEHFQALPMKAQCGLLKHFSAQHLVMCAAFRSIHVADAVWLTNESCLPRGSGQIPDVNKVAERILDHVTKPMKKLAMDEGEYMAMKAISFFDSMAKGVDDSLDQISKIRETYLAALEYHITKRSAQRNTPRRLANLLLLLPSIMAIARDLVEDVQLASIFGLASIGELMTELLLSEGNDAEHYNNLKSAATSDKSVNEDNV